MDWQILIKDEKTKPYLEKLDEISKVLLENTGKLEKGLSESLL